MENFNDEELLKKKKEELLKRLEQQKQLEFLIQQIESQLKQILSKEAFNRYINIKTANPEFALQVAQYVIQLKQSGLILNELTDEKFKALVNKLLPRKREPKIKFIRK
jgi:DNA-binding TFAR19-related protein (PDSD5 family)